MRDETPDCTQCSKTAGDAEHTPGCPATIDGTASGWPAYLVYTPGQAEPETRKRREPFTLEEMQALVGGYIQLLPGPKPATQAVMNEEGKLDGLPRNEAATRVMNERGLLFPGDYIAGVMIVAPDDLIE